MRWVPRPAAAGCECPPAPGSPGVWGARPRGEGAAGWGALEERYSIVPEQVQWNHHRALKHACLSPVAGRRRHARAAARARWWRVLRAGVHLGKGIPWSRRVEVSPHHVPRLHSSSYGAHVQWDHEGALRLLASPVGGGARARARALQGSCALGCTWGKVFHGPLV